MSTLQFGADAGVLEVTSLQGDISKPETWTKQLSRDDLFRNKKVLIVGIPGAFTPVCTTKHLPGFLEKASQLGQLGLDATYVVGAANDPFVMRAFAESLGGDKFCGQGRIRVLADGNLTLTQALGLTLSMAGRGLGTRSKRYACLIDQGIVMKLFVENQPNDLKVTDAAHVMEACRTALT